jgi:hypothetical protein
VVWAGLLKKPLEAVRRSPRWALLTASGSRDASHTGATRLPVLSVIVVGCGSGPLRALLEPLIAAFDSLLGVVSGDIRRHLLVMAQGHLPASLCWVKHDCLVASGALGGNAAPHLKHAPKEVPMFALPKALHTVFGQRARASLVSFMENLRFIMSSPPLPWHGLG